MKLQLIVTFLPFILSKPIPEEDIVDQAFNALGSISETLVEQAKGAGQMLEESRENTGNSKNDLQNNLNQNFILKHIQIDDLLDVADDKVGVKKNVGAGLNTIIEAYNDNKKSRNQVWKPIAKKQIDNAMTFMDNQDWFTDDVRGSLKQIAKAVNLGK